MNPGERRSSLCCSWTIAQAGRFIRPPMPNPTTAASCRTCGQEFMLRPWHLRNRDYRCQPCRTEQTRRWREKNLAHLRQYDRAWKDANPDKRLAQEQRRKPQKTEYYHWYWRTHPHRVLARNKTKEAVKSGKLVRQPCASCGNPKSQGHHHAGYDKPLEVTWLCQRCHAKEHLKSA